MSKSRMMTWSVVVILSWYGMMAIHEAGHCFGALATGAKIDAVQIPIAGFSRTDFSESRSPLLVVWAGPLLGAVMPALLLALLGVVTRRIKHVLLFFVGFCLLANGAYIGLGAFSGAGDCRQLARSGCPTWLMAAFGIASSGSGLLAWHKMGPLRCWFARVNRNEIEQN